jgi:hypothetical protein
MVKELSFFVGKNRTALLKTVENGRGGRTTFFLFYVDATILTGSTHDEDYPCHPGLSASLDTGSHTGNSECWF